MIRPRPKCGHCGQRFGVRSLKTWTVRYTGDNPPAYTGDQILITETTPYPTSESEHVMYRRTWDGKTWYAPHEPFCTLRCALTYARMAFRKLGPIP
jgi:hypothetical protein